jgi:hypothetical protein
VVLVVSAPAVGMRAAGFGVEVVGRLPSIGNEAAVVEGKCMKERRRPLPKRRYIRRSWGWMDGLRVSECGRANIVGLLGTAALSGLSGLRRYRLRRFYMVCSVSLVGCH